MRETFLYVSGNFPPKRLKVFSIYAARAVCIGFLEARLLLNAWTIVSMP